MGGRKLTKVAGKLPFTKKPTSFSTQVELLKSRGLNIPDEALAEFYLSQINYYRFAAYCLPFEADHAAHTFRHNVSFNDVLNLYIFDRELRLLVLDAIERIEVSLRTKLAYHLSHNYQLAHPQLHPGLFKSHSEYKKSKDKLDNDIKSSSEDFIQHLKGKYTESQPPIWAVVELMTMGQLSRWFSNINARADRVSISDNYGLNEAIMTSFCEHLSLVRNSAAHHCRFWNREFTKTPRLPKNASRNLVSSLLVLPDSDRRVRKLYNTFVILAYLMEKICRGTHWVDRFKALIAQHKIDTTKMGFPQDWLKKPIWLSKVKRNTDKTFIVEGITVFVSFDVVRKIYRGEFIDSRGGDVEIFETNIFLLKRTVSNLILSSRFS